MELAKTEGIPVILVGHVTKDGTLAGPKTLEHLVDVVLSIEGDRTGGLRLLRAAKNRYGSTEEVGVFEMRDHGLAEVADPARAFLAEHDEPAPGSVVAPVLEGSRPILVEVQALVAPTTAPSPRRTASGVDPNRLALLVAVLGRRAGIGLGGHDVYANLAGGLSVDGARPRPAAGAGARLVAAGPAGRAGDRGDRRGRPAGRAARRGWPGATAARGRPPGLHPCRGPACPWPRDGRGAGHRGGRGGVAGRCRAGRPRGRSDGARRAERSREAAPALRPDLEVPARTLTHGPVRAVPSRARLAQPPRPSRAPAASALARRTSVIRTIRVLGAALGALVGLGIAAAGTGLFTGVDYAGFILAAWTIAWMIVGFAVLPYLTIVPPAGS